MKNRQAAKLKSPPNKPRIRYIYTYAIVNVTLSRFRSKEITGTHSHVYLTPIIPGLKLNTNRFVFKCKTGTWWTLKVLNTLIQDCEVFV